MLSVTVPRSTSLKQACDRFLDEIEAWIADCVRTYADAPATNGHDQGTYTVSWLPCLQARPDPKSAAFLSTTRDRIAKHFHETGQWRHGYWTMHEAHHGTEHYELFLGMLSRLAPNDGETVRQLLDAAEHLGNWVTEIPAWYDWDHGRYLSMYFGVEGVKLEKSLQLNIPDHLRCLNIALLAWSLSREERYLQLATHYGGQWAEAILAADELPAGLDLEGPIYSLEANKSYYRFAGQAPKLSNQVDRAENLLASNAPNGLLELWRATNEPRFRQAAEGLLDVLATQFFDPDAGAAVDAVRHYRAITGESRYDSVLLEAVSKTEPCGFTELAIEPEVSRPGPRTPGVGKRSDLPAWFEDGKPRRHNPILLAHAAEISGDKALAARAIDLARAYFDLARQVYPDGRDHGCSARTVSAIARGHGRENNAGMITAVLAPICQCFRAN